MRTKLPIEEQDELSMLLEYDGCNTIEQLEDVIGEESACAICHGDGVNYDVEITIKRIKRSDHED